MLRCKAVYTGGNYKRHNAVQQELLPVHWFREAGANVVCTPGVQSFTGAEPASAVDLGVCGLDDGPVIAVDLCVSDCGTGSPSRKFKSGAKSETSCGRSGASIGSALPSHSGEPAHWQLPQLRRHG